MNNQTKQVLYETIKQVLSESTTLKYKGHSFVLNVKANSDPTKDGLGITLVPPFGELTPTEQSDITTDILQRLNDGLGKYGLVASIDTQLKDKSKIAYFIYTDNFKKLIRQALQKSNQTASQDLNSEPDEQQPDQSGGE